MGLLTNSLSFTITSATVFSEDEELYFLPENDGSDALRELAYPNDALPALIYQKNPDKYTNFDSDVLTDAGVLAVDKTLESNVFTRWSGAIADRSITEVWSGSENRASMRMYFFRRLWEYYRNPPASGYIEWKPKDRTDKTFYIEIEKLTVAGEDVTMDYLANRGGYVMGEVRLTFRIVQEV